MKSGEVESSSEDDEHDSDDDDDDDEDDDEDEEDNEEEEDEEDNERGSKTEVIVSGSEELVYEEIEPLREGLRYKKMLFLCRSFSFDT